MTKKQRKKKIVPVVKDTEKKFKNFLADAWRMAQEIDRAIPILEKAAKMSKDGESYVLLGTYIYQKTDLKKQPVQ